MDDELNDNISKLDAVPDAEMKQLKRLSLPENCEDIEFLRKLDLEMLDNERSTSYSSKTPEKFWKDWDSKKKSGGAKAPSPPSP